MPSSPQVRRRLAWASSVVAGAVLATSGVGWGMLAYGSARIGRIDPFAGLTHRPARTTSSAVNYLLVGSDTRVGMTRKELAAMSAGSVASAAGARSDTMIIVHISQNRDKAVLVSLPRDSYVAIPAYTDAKGVAHKASHAKLNAAYALGGAKLTVATVEQATGVRLDHYVEVNFAGFATMVDALGGVKLCIKKPIKDPKTQLDLAAGTHVLDGVTALKYVRARYFDGRGDIGRMQRQQKFLGAMLRQAESSDVMLDPVKLARFVNAALDSVRTDKGLSRTEILDLATRLRSLDPAHVTFLTVPLSNPDYRPGGGLGSTVLWDKGAAGGLFRALRDDLPVDAPAVAAAAAGAVTVSPDTVHIRVLNAAGVPGLAGKAATVLVGLGFHLDTPAANAATTGATTTYVRYDPVHADEARTLHAALPGSVLQPSAGLGPILEVDVGSAFNGVTPVTVHSAAATPKPATTGRSLTVRSAADDPCA